MALVPLRTTRGPNVPAPYDPIGVNAIGAGFFGVFEALLLVDGFGFGATTATFVFPPPHATPTKIAPKKRRGRRDMIDVRAPQRSGCDLGAKDERQNTPTHFPLSHRACSGPDGHASGGHIDGGDALQIASTLLTQATFPDVLPHHQQHVYGPESAMNVTAQSVSTEQLVSMAGRTMPPSASLASVAASMPASALFAVVGVVALAHVFEGSRAIEESSRPRQHPRQSATIVSHREDIAPPTRAPRNRSISDRPRRSRVLEA
jgi:hypothetical protein